MRNKNPAQDKKISEKITLCSDGKYRWVYELNLFKNPFIFFLIWKILFFAFLIIFTVANISDYVNWGAEKVIENLPFLGYFLLGMTAVTALGYLIYALIMGGKYIIEFEMDEKGINHKQIEAQAKKAKKIAGATILAGAASGKISTVGVGVSAQRTEMYSDFSKVRKVKSYPRRNLIKVNGLLSHNQVYAASEDFTFVLNFIKSHCPNIKN